MQKTNRDISGLLKSAKEKNIKTSLHVNKTLKKMIEGKQIITFSHVAKQAQVSRSWLYKNDKIRHQIEDMREKQDKKIPSDFGTGEAHGQRQNSDKLKRRIKKLQQENGKLREQLEVIYGKMLEKEAIQR